MRRRNLAAAAALALAAPRVLRAQGAFPDRPITLVTGYSPGGSTDIAARLLSDRLAAHLGPQARIVVENRPGASGAICTEWLKRQAPDGYTIMVQETGAGAIAPAALVGGTRYDPLADFTQLGIIGVPPLVLVVTNGFAAGSPAATVAKLREAPAESLTYATSGVGGVLHLAAEMLGQTLGTRFVHVPYRSGAQMLQSIHTGEAQFGIAALASAAQMMKDRMVTPVALTGSRRFPTFPEVPTLVEAGVAGFEFDTWFTIIGPAGMPQPVAAAINRALVASLHEDALARRLNEAGHDAFRGPNSLADARAFMEREVAKLRQVVARTGVRLEP